ncbi:hypothetical protein COCON_G00154920 [Conger conger]|uniref:Chemokine interleukin-8-like domain-containing protein n=1 Tax=Conger conger TaxID=82655 RepID=A0A9Q1HUQ0_CONCO|nr:hypothetical protein COCON_G00154920 [Conger conger]
MNMAHSIFLCVIVFGVGLTYCSGQDKGTERCICSGNPMKSVRPNRLLTTKTFPASAFCTKIEIVVTLKTGKKLCLDPHGRQGKRILSKKRPLTRGKARKGKRGQKKRRNFG